MTMLTIPDKLIISKDSNKVFISHVGDHEYSFNVFGSVHTNITKYLLKLSEYSKCPTDKLKIVEYPENTFEIFNTTFKIPYRIAYLTIVEIDPEEFPYEDA